MQFIDYEYSGYNYLAYDIGNHFNEFAGKKIDFRGKDANKKSSFLYSLLMPVYLDICI